MLKEKILFIYLLWLETSAGPGAGIIHQLINAMQYGTITLQ